MPLLSHLLEKVIKAPEATSIDHAGKLNVNHRPCNRVSSHVGYRKQVDAELRDVSVKETEAIVIRDFTIALSYVEIV